MTSFALAGVGSQSAIMSSNPTLVEYDWGVMSIWWKWCVNNAFCFHCWSLICHFVYVLYTALFFPSNNSYRNFPLWVLHRGFPLMMHGRYNNYTKCGNFLWDEAYCMYLRWWLLIASTCWRVSVSPVCCTMWRVRDCESRFLPQWITWTQRTLSFDYFLMTIWSSNKKALYCYCLLLFVLL